MMPDQVPDTMKTSRSGELLAMERMQSKNFRSHYIGKEAEVLWEETKEIVGKEYVIGHTKDYVKVAIPLAPGGMAGEQYTNTLQKVLVEDFLTDEILVAKEC